MLLHEVRHHKGSKLTGPDKMILFLRREKAPFVIFKFLSFSWELLTETFQFFAFK